MLLGIATGLLWAPCAGPILGLVLTGAAISGANLRTSLLLLSYAAGAACSLGLAIAVGGRAFAAMKRSLGVREWVRRVLGVAARVYAQTHHSVEATVAAYLKAFAAMIAPGAASADR